MELIHIANATFSSSKENTSLENLASKQKTFQIVKEHTMRPAHRAFTPAHVFTWARAQRASRVGPGGAAKLVEPAGIEPATSWLQTRRSPS